MKRLFLALLLILLVGAGWLWWQAPALPTAERLMEAKTLQPAPDFSLSDLHGRQVRLTDLKGQVVLVNFWASWCPPCRQEMPSMEELYRQLHGEGVELLAINVEENAAVAAAAFLQQHPHSFPVLLDPQADAQKAYNVSRFPETFIVDRDGQIVERVVGAIDWADPRVIDFLRQL